MRIIRFLDENNEMYFGHDYYDGAATLLTGELFGDLIDTGERVQVKKLLAPLQPPAILCIGLNYHQHAQEFKSKIPEYPALFMKNPASIAHPEDPIILPPSCMNPPEVDYEVEVVVIIGKTAKDVSAADALDYVFGYTIGNDVSARNWQKDRCGGQWVRGKSFDTFCPLGPVMVTKDEISDPQALQIKSILNGQVMQDGNTSDMIFPVVRLVETLSSYTTLLPGTVILTGTPSGVGFARKPPVFLMPGDTIEMVIDNIGILRNSVVAG